MKWIELELNLSPELVEPVSELLSRHIPNGLAISPTNPTDKLADTAYTLRAWLPVDGQLEERQQRITEGLWHLSQIAPIPTPTYRDIEQENWADNWRAGYRPLDVGQKLQVVPAWFQPAGTARIPIIIEYGMAFGTGTHPTTRLCLRALEKHLRSGDTLVDIGTGTGILSIAGILLGAERAVAADLDQEAVRAAIGNCEANRVSDRVEVIHGSIDTIREHLDQNGIVPGCCAVNIVEKVLLELLDSGLSDLLPPDRIYIISGLLQEQLPAFLEQAENRGFAVCEVLQEGEWQAAVVRNGERPPGSR